MSSPSRMSPYYLEGWRSLGRPIMDGQYNRVVRIGLRGGNEEGTRQELLAATHCIRPSNGWNLTTATNFFLFLVLML